MATSSQRFSSNLLHGFPRGNLGADRFGGTSILDFLVPLRATEGHRHRRRHLPFSIFFIFVCSFHLFGFISFIVAFGEDTSASQTPYRQGQTRRLHSRGVNSHRHERRTGHPHTDCMVFGKRLLQHTEDCLLNGHHGNMENK